jgi:hypothetical protein
VSGRLNGERTCLGQFGFKWIYRSRPVIPELNQEPQELNERNKKTKEEDGGVEKIAIY